MHKTKEELEAEALLEQQTKDAFESGFDDTETVLPVEEPAAEAAPVAETPSEVAPEAAPVAEQAPAEVDPWEGVNPALKTQFDKMTTLIETTRNDANAASGRARKLQDTIDKMNQQATPQPKTTAELLQLGLEDKEARDKIREDDPELASMLDQMDESINKRVGTAIESLTGTLNSTIDQSLTKQQEFNESIRALDLKHPEWENTVSKNEFKEWAFAGGPSAQERANYDYYLSNAATAATQSPEQADKWYAAADQYYATLLGAHPVWAADRGALYGDSSSTAAIQLLDKYDSYSAAQEQANIQVPPKPADIPAAPTANLFEDNLAPTDGSRVSPQDSAEDVNKAFEEGFNS